MSVPLVGDFSRAADDILIKGYPKKSGELQVFVESEIRPTLPFGALTLNLGVAGTKAPVPIQKLTLVNRELIKRAELTATLENSRSLTLKAVAPNQFWGIKATYEVAARDFTQFQSASFKVATDYQADTHSLSSSITGTFAGKINNVVASAAARPSGNVLLGGEVTFDVGSQKLSSLKTGLALNHETKVLGLFGNFDGNFKPEFGAKVSGNTSDIKYAVSLSAKDQKPEVGLGFTKPLSDGVVAKVSGNSTGVVQLLLNYRLEKSGSLALGAIIDVNNGAATSLNLKFTA